MRLFTTVMSFLFLFFIAWAILSKRIKDGVVMKAGLIIMATGFFAAGASGFSKSDTWIEAHVAAHALIYFGLGVCVLKYLQRTHKTRRREPRRRASDWSELRKSDGAAIPS